MSIIETEVWKGNPDRPGTIIFDKSRPAQDVFNELEAHLIADGRMPDEYFLFDASSNWSDGALFPKDGQILCSANYGGSEGVYLDISVCYEKEVHEFNKAANIVETKKRMVTEHFATGKTLGETIDDLDKMNLVAASVYAAFYGMEREVQERYAKIENGEILPTYPRLLAEQNEKPEPASEAEKLITHKRKSSKNDLLVERLEKNLSDYHKSLESFCDGELIDMASRISDMSDAHWYMVMQHGFSETELDFYLQFQNPLEIVADELTARNRDISDISCLMEHICKHQDDYLVDYPHIEDAVLSDNSLHRYMDIDLELCLGKIANKVMIHHKTDWDIDLKILRRAALSDNPEEKRFFWHVCGFGTHLSDERDTYIRDTFDFNAMTDYRVNDTDMFGYYIEVTGMSDGVIKGNVFDIGDYPEFAKHIRKTAEPLESLTLIYSDQWGVNAGKAVNVSRKEYDNDRHRLMSESGNVVKKVYHPNDKTRLASFISSERSKRMAYPVVSSDELLRKVAEKLSVVRKSPEKQPQEAVKTKPKSLSEKMQAATEKVKAQESLGGNAKTRKNDERQGL